MDKREKIVVEKLTYYVLCGIRLDGIPETVLVAEDEYEGPPDEYLTLGASFAEVVGQLQIHFAKMDVAALPTTIKSRQHALGKFSMWTKPKENSHEH